MSRSARRKTLSHSEIENFLNDIAFSSKTDVAKSRPEASSISEMKENCHEPWFDDTEQDSCTINLPRSSSEAVGKAKKKVSSIEVCSEIQSIRDFCKLTFRRLKQFDPIEVSPQLCSIAKTILDKTTYPILTKRLLRPEQYLYPINSLEAKKSLLISLSPMLSDAEVERTKETVACESFTRCRSSKGKSRYSSYDYTDMDTQSKVAYVEYEKRYLMYIAQNKKTYANTLNDGGSVAIHPATYLNTVSLKKTAAPLTALAAAAVQSNSIAPSIAVVSSQTPPLPVPATTTPAAALPLQTQQQQQMKDTKRFTQPKRVYVSAPQTAAGGGGGGCVYGSIDSSSGNKENHGLSSLNENAAYSNSLAAAASVIDSDTMILLKSIAIVKSATGLSKTMPLRTMTISGSKGDDKDVTSIQSPVKSGGNINEPPPSPAAAMDTVASAVEVSSPGAVVASGGSSMFDNRKRKHMSRRGTLSPGTARAMMLEAFAMDTRRQDNSCSNNSSSSSGGSGSTINSPLKLNSTTSLTSSVDCSPLKHLSNISVGSMDIVADDGEDDSITSFISDDSLDSSSRNSRGTEASLKTMSQRLSATGDDSSVIIDSISSSDSSNRIDDDTSSSRAESPLQKFQRSESPDPTITINQSQPTTGDRLDIVDGDDDGDGAHEMDLEEAAVDGGDIDGDGASVDIEGIERMAMVTVEGGDEEIASMEAYGKELDSLLCDVSSCLEVEAMGVDPSLSTNMSIDIDAYSPSTPSVSSMIDDDTIRISMDDCRDDNMSILINTSTTTTTAGGPSDYDISDGSTIILTHDNSNTPNIIRPLPSIQLLHHTSPIPTQKRLSPLPSRYFLVETMDGACVSDPDSAFHIKCPSPMNQRLTVSSSASSSSSSYSTSSSPSSSSLLSSPSLKPPSPPIAPPSMKPSPLQKRAYNVSPIACALSPLFNQSLSSIADEAATANESTDGRDGDDDIIMQDSVDASSDDHCERIQPHHFDASEVIDECSDTYRAAAVAPFTPIAPIAPTAAKDGLCDSNSQAINISSSRSSSSKPSTIIHDSCSVEDASPYSLVQYYRKQLCPSSSSSDDNDDEQLLLGLGSDCSSFELLESMLEQEYLLCQGGRGGIRGHDDDNSGDDVDGDDSGDGDSVEQRHTTSPPSYSDSYDSIHADRASFSINSELSSSQPSVAASSSVVAASSPSVAASSSVVAASSPSEAASSSAVAARLDTYCGPSSIITIDHEDVQLAQQTSGLYVLGDDDDDCVDACDSIALAPLDLLEIEVQAKRRLKLRMEAVHWQYKWEMVMARLINTVIEKKQQRKKIADL